MRTRRPPPACDVKTLEHQLAALPPLQAKITKRKLIAQLGSAIEAARDKGYNLREITEQLQKNGLEIAYSTVRNYLPYQRRRTKKTSSPRSRTANAATIPVSRPVEAPQETPTGNPRSPLGSARKNAPGTPTAPKKPYFPPGASFIPIGNGEFLPAPDSDDF